MENPKLSQHVPNKNAESLIKIGLMVSLVGSQVIYGQLLWTIEIMD